MFIGCTPHRAGFSILLALCIYLSGAVVIYASELALYELDSKEIAGNIRGITNIRKFQVYLPDEYHRNTDKRYPVLYWIPGWMGGTWDRTHVDIQQALDSAIADGSLPPAIAVFADVTEGLLCLNSDVFGKWENFIISELIPFMDREFRTIPTNLARGLMGHSSSGYTAFILPMLHPNTWGAIGVNDPAMWIMWSYLRNAAAFQKMPEDFGGYGKTGVDVMIILQLGTSFTPNPDSPLFCDLPATKEGKWNPEIRDEWSQYDLSNAQALAQHSDRLKKLLSISVVVPSMANNTNRNVSIELIQILESAGISVTRLDMPGGHGDQPVERFIAMAEQILEAMVGANVSVPSQGSLVSIWGAIKQEW